MFGIGAMELVVILILALIIFGPSKLPEVGRAIGRSVREFRKAASEVMDDDRPAGEKDR
ncbi:MAG: twin-arginine translocase TatA/TatE family subunit [Limnochordales bacterium]|nr:twin-arginine translocase TatA/TatE family subunit [Bacillota bacterium]REJ32044.1 MAG: twin-arginine translocase TatA/TatE family subunit [Bacillota bacterium]